MRWNATRKRSSKRPAARCYSAVLHYLKAIEATGGDAADPVMEWMKANPSQDPIFGEGTIRVDGRHMHDMFLMQVKTPAESTGPEDYFKVLATIPADKAFRPLDQGECPLVK